MPIYDIEQYELHVQRYRIDADSEADAVAQLFDGEADPVDGSLEYIEVADGYGLPVDENMDLVVELRNLQLTIGSDLVPSIRSIAVVE